MGARVESRDSLEIELGLRLGSVLGLCLGLERRLVLEMRARSSTRSRAVTRPGSKVGLGFAQGRVLRPGPRLKMRLLPDGDVCFLVLYAHVTVCRYE